MHFISHIFVFFVFINYSFLYSSPSSIAEKLNSIAQYLNSIQSIREADSIDEKRYQNLAENLATQTAFLHQQLSQCYDTALQSYNSSLYDAFITSCTENLENIVTVLSEFSQSLCDFLSLQTIQTPIKNLHIFSDVSFLSFLTSLQQINTGFDSFLSAYERVESKIYTNFHCLSHLNQFMHYLTLWNSRLDHMQNIELNSSKNGQTFSILQIISQEIINFYTKIETLKRKFTRLEQIQSLQNIQDLLSHGLTKTFSNQNSSLSILDIIAKLKLTPEGLPSLTPEGNLIFDETSLAYKTANLYYNLQKILTNFGIKTAKKS